MTTSQKILLAITALVLGTVSVISLVVALRPSPAAVVDTAAINQTVNEAVETAFNALPTPAPAADPLDMDDVKAAAAEGAQGVIDDFIASQTTPEPTGTLTNTNGTGTPDLTATPTPTPTVALESEEAITNTAMLTPTFELILTDYYTQPIEFAGGPSIHLSQNGDWFALHTANASWPNIGQTWKTAADGCTLPAGCNVVGPEGVGGADDYTEASENPSFIWLGSIYHDSPDATDTEFAMLCPEGSFCSAYALQFGDVEIGSVGNPFITLNIPTCGEHCGQGLLIQNWLERPDLDLNTTVVVRDYGEPAAASYTEYAVDPDDAERFSEAYLTAQAENAHARRNNGSGPDDNDLFIQHIFSLTDMSYTILGHTAEAGWFLIWTNVGEYGTH